MAVVYSGAYEVAASNPHSRLDRLILNVTMKHSVTARADTVESPPTFNDEMVRDGFEHYDENVHCLSRRSRIEQNVLDGIRRGQSVRDQAC